VGGPGGGAVTLSGARIEGAGNIAVNPNSALTGTGTIDLCGACRVDAERSAAFGILILQSEYWRQQQPRRFPAPNLRRRFQLGSRNYESGRSVAAGGKHGVLYRYAAAACRLQDTASRSFQEFDHFFGNAFGRCRILAGDEVSVGNILT